MFAQLPTRILLFLIHGWMQAFNFNVRGFWFLVWNGYSIHRFFHCCMRRQIRGEIIDIGFILVLLGAISVVLVLWKVLGSWVLDLSFSCNSKACTRNPLLIYEDTPKTFSSHRCFLWYYVFFFLFRLILIVRTSLYFPVYSIASFDSLLCLFISLVCVVGWGCDLVTGGKREVHLAT